MTDNKEIYVINRDFYFCRSVVFNKSGSPSPQTCKDKKQKRTFIIRDSKFFMTMAFK